jgi:galactitol-specific phosphotransferase system IIC component
MAIKDYTASSSSSSGATGGTSGTSFYGFLVNSTTNLIVDELPLTDTIDVSNYDTWELNNEGLVYSLVDGNLFVS